MTTVGATVHIQGAEGVGGGRGRGRGLFRSVSVSVRPPLFPGPSFAHRIRAPFRTGNPCRADTAMLSQGPHRNVAFSPEGSPREAHRAEERQLREPHCGGPPRAPRWCRRCRKGGCFRPSVSISTGVPTSDLLGLLGSVRSAVGLHGCWGGSPETPPPPSSPVRPTFRSVPPNRYWNLNQSPVRQTCQRRDRSPTPPTTPPP